MVLSRHLAVSLSSYQSQNQVAIMPTALEFLENHGKNILLSNGNRHTRVASYNQGIVVINQPLVALAAGSGEPHLLIPSSLLQVTRANSPVERLFFPSEG